MLEHGGEVTGIIPEFLTKRERPRRLAQELIVTRDMHERKRTMFERADAFVALPGGIGTLEELVEQLTWAQLGRHKKPILIANINGYWDPLLALIEHMRDAGIRAGGARAWISWSPNASRTFCRSCAKPRARSPKRKRRWRCRPSGCDRHPGARAAGIGSLTSSRYRAIVAQKRHRLDAVAVRIADEGGVIVR